MTGSPVRGRAGRCVTLVLAVLLASATMPVDASLARSTRTHSFVMPERHADPPAGLLVRRGSAASRDAAGAPAASTASSPTGTGWSVLRPVPGQSLAALRSQLESDPGVLDIEIEHYVYPAYAPTDPLYPQQWALDDPVGHQDIDAPGGWSLLESRSLVGTSVVAVVDSGIDLDHPDLASRLWINDDIPGNGIDDDLNGYIDDVSGWDFDEGDASPDDESGHGTHVAGIVAARADNATGTVGVAGAVAGVSIMPVRIFGALGGASTELAAQGVRYAVDNGADIVNVSWGGDEDNTVLAEAIAYAEQHGIIVVAAAGNQSTSNDTSPFYPASYAYDNIVAVASTGRDGALSAFSNRGAGSVDIAAPGADILSTWPGGTWTRMSGTSMAAPHVTGALALARLRFPGEHYSSVRGRVLQGRAVAALDGFVASGSILDLTSTLSTISPVGTMTIEDSRSSVSTHSVTLQSNVVGATEMLIDSDHDGSVDVSHSFAPAVRVTLPSGDGTRTVDVTYRGETTQTLSLSASIRVDTVAPGPPSGLVAIPLGQGVELMWDAPDDPDVDSYAVWRSEEGSAGPFVRSPQLVVGQTQAEYTGLENGRDYWFRVSAVDQAGNEGPAGEVARVRPTIEVGRIAGRDRYETACLLSADAFETADTVVVTTGEGFADAVVASSLAGALEAPLLFVRAQSIPASTAEEITRLNAGKIVVVGGEAAISATVYTQLADASSEIERLSGSNRYETSAEVAREVARLSGTGTAASAWVVRGDEFPDSVSVSAIAYARRMPVLLVRPKSLPGQTARVAEELELQRVYVAGGVSAVSDGVLVDLGLPFTRVQGSDRYATSVAVAEMAVSRGWASVGYLGVASGVEYADALSGGASLGARDGLIVLTRPHVPVPGVTLSFVRQHAVGGRSVRVLGGTKAVSERARLALDAAID